MAHNRIEEVIHSIVDCMGLHYIYDRWQTVNIRLDKGDLPCVVNVLPVSGTFDIGRMYKDAPNCFIAFLEKAELDFDGHENEDAVDLCKHRAKQFIKLLNESNEVAPISGNVPYSVVYDKLDTATTGIVIELTIKELTGICPPSLESVAGGGDCGCNNG